VALHDHRRPWRAGPAVLALLAVIAIVDGLRERDVVAATLFDSSTHTDYDEHHDSDCSGTDWDDPLDIEEVGDRFTVVPELTGNVGRLVEKATPAEDDSGVLRLAITGDVEVGWFGCLVPLHKSVQVDAVLQYSAEVWGDRGRGHAACNATGTVALHVEHEVNGFAACRDIREALAKVISEKLDKTARDLIE